MSNNNNNSRNDDAALRAFLERGLFTAATHPFEYAKILIQIGYEPLEPVSGRTLLGRVTLFYPNIFKYISYIVQRDGYLGLYRGLTPRLIGYALSGVVYQKVTKSIRFEGETPETAELSLPDIVGPNEEAQVVEGDVPGNSSKNFLRKLVKDLAGRIASVIVSQPFMVVAARTCAQFVGRESHYKGILPSFQEIFSREGMQGLFAGITPRLIGEVLALVISSSVTFAANQFVQTRELRGYVSLSVSVLVSSLTYPFHVVSTTMAVNNSRIVAGLPPFTPLYGNWCECWRDLRQKNQLKRGANVFFRLYPGPKIVIGGIAYPMGPTVTELPDHKML